MHGAKISGFVVEGVSTILENFTKIYLLCGTSGIFTKC